MFVNAFLLRFSCGNIKGWTKPFQRQFYSTINHRHISLWTFFIQCSQCLFKLLLSFLTHTHTHTCILGDMQTSFYFPPPLGSYWSLFNKTGYPHPLCLLPCKRSKLKPRVQLLIWREISITNQFCCKIEERGKSEIEHQRTSQKLFQLFLALWIQYLKLYFLWYLKTGTFVTRLNSLRVFQ
jgi:hypothetical protein